MSFLKKIFKPISKVINAIPGGQFLADAALTATGNPEFIPLLNGVNTIGSGGSLGQGLISAGTSYLGNALTSGALGDFSGGIGDTLNKVGDSLGINGFLTDASGALSNGYDAITNNLSDLYKGSGVQDVFNSGKDALKSVGINTGTDNVGTALTPSVGGGASSYGGSSGALAAGNGSDNLLNSDKLFDGSTLNKATNNIPTSANNVGTFFNSAPNSSALNNLTSTGISNTGGNVASNSSSFLAPLLSAGVGTLTNNSAKNSLLKSAAANKALLQPYLNFQFNPGDLTQDPGYQFNLQQGNQALDRKQLAGGNYLSGGAVKEAEQFGSGLADNTYNAAFSRALQTNQQGLTGANAVANVNNEIGNTNAASTVNNGNLYSGALASLVGGNGFTNTGNLTGGLDIQTLLRQLNQNRSSYAA